MRWLKYRDCDNGCGYTFVLGLALALATIGIAGIVGCFE